MYIKENNETISEETLEKISAGINVDKNKLKKILIKSGVVISACTPVIGLTDIGLYKLNKRAKENSNSKPKEERVILNTTEIPFTEVGPKIIYGDIDSESEEE